MTETLRMQASADVGKAIASLRAVQRELAKTAQGPSFANMRRDLAGLEQAVHGTGRALRTVAIPALAAFGASLGAAGIAGAILGITSALKGFSESALDLKFLSQET